MSDIEEDEFQDAQESFSEPTFMDLDTSIADAKQAVYLFFNNDFKQAKKILEPWAATSIYHSLGASVFAFLEALLTFEQKHIEKASEALKQTISLCSKYRKHSTFTENIGKIVKRTNYDAYTLEEVHAELCYAEALLLKSVLAFVEDETLVSFVRAGLKIRTCFLSYKECLAMLKHRQWGDDTHKLHFESGVRMGIGAFNLMISLLPARIIKLLECIGFSGDKEYGISELKEGYNERKGLRHLLCGLTLLSYNLIISTDLNYMDGDLDWCENVLRAELTDYPNGVWFLFFKGKLEFTRANFEECVEWYTKSWKSQSVWPKFHYICFWEFMWTYCCMQKWSEAVKYADMLAKESNWSRTIFYYQKAVLLLTQKPAPNSEMEQQIHEIMTDAPTFKQRIAGKSLPMEKFVIKRCQRYFAQKKFLVLPVYELMFLWNFFKVLKKREELMLKVFEDIEDAEKCLEKRGKTEYQADNEALLLLLKGACLREMKHPYQAEECFKRVLELEKSIKEDTHLIPYAVVELSLLAEDQGDTQLAIKLLENARKNYTRYHLESRLHFRIHAGLMKLTKKINDH